MNVGRNGLYGKMISKIEKLDDPENANEREKIITELKEFIEYTCDLIETSNQDIKPDGYKWVIIKKSEGEITGHVVSDLKQLTPYLNISESSIRRKARANGNSFNHNGYLIVNLPYYKSKRGNE